jgi:hypothetical protein
MRESWPLYLYCFALLNLNPSRRASAPISCQPRSSRAMKSFSLKRTPLGGWCVSTVTIIIGNILGIRRALCHARMRGMVSIGRVALAILAVIG